jgi:hypothetical protein
VEAVVVKEPQQLVHPGDARRAGNPGGSGGGAGVYGTTKGTGGATTQGSVGGWSSIFGYGSAGTTAIDNNAGGGGGAGGAGASQTAGGVGMNMSSFFNTTRGNNGWFASGGGAHDNGGDALANTGMGGRAQATNNGDNGRPGADGIILIRWRYGIYIKEESPKNETLNVDFDSNSKWEIYVYHSDGNTTNGSIECSTGDNMSWTDEGNGTKTLNLPNLDNSTVYTVWVNATDGTVTLNRTYWFKTRRHLTDENGMTWHIYEFTEGDGIWEVPEGIKAVDVLLVAGGGGSGKGTTDENYNFGSGGGAGGLIWYQNYPIKNENISYSVGNAGIGATGSRGGNGGDTIFGDMVAIGGGGGGGGNGGFGNVGGSGGAGWTYVTYGLQSQMSQNGYSGNGGISEYRSPAGGGGAGSTGSRPAGGPGLNMSSYFGTSYSNNGWFASGGGGNDYGEDAIANSGMGGRAPARNSADNGRDGGSGIILIKVSLGTQIYDEHPVENSVVDIYKQQWKINISHLAGNSTNGTIECSNGNKMNWTNQPNGTRILDLDILEYNQIYTIYINVTDNNSSIKKTYNFFTPKTYTDVYGLRWIVADITIKNTNGTLEGIWEPPHYTKNFDILIAGGGGGSGRISATITANNMAGGGGAGGLIWIKNYNTNDSNIHYTIGRGGQGALVSGERGTSGENTIFKNLTALGGGGGGGQVTGKFTGISGGSGGGGGIDGSGATHAGGSGLQPLQDGWSGLYGYGNDGAPGRRSSPTSYGGGGGGAGGIGGGTYWEGGGDSQLPLPGPGKDMTEYFGKDFGYNGIFSQGGGSANGPVPTPPDSGWGGRAASRGATIAGYTGSNGVILIRWAPIIYATNFSIIHKSIVRADIEKWEVDIIQYLGNLTSGTIECSNGNNMSWTNQPNGTRTLIFGSLEYETIYTIWVNATDGEYFFNESYWFKTSSIYKDWYLAAIKNEEALIYIYKKMTEIDVLIVAGGGGSGTGTTNTGRNAGGGGGGGVIWIKNMTIAPDIFINYGIGDGGPGSTSSSAIGENGGDTIFGNLTAKGGGGGGSTYSYVNARAGGSGGGAGVYGSTTGSGGAATQPSQAGWSGMYGYGNPGGTSSTNNARGGGGAGGTTTTTTGGAGMDMSTYFGTSYGNSGVFASGGGAHNVGVDALPNSGMGGRAQATSSSSNGRSGSSGIIVIRWSTGIVYLDDKPANNSENVTGLLTNWSVYVHHKNVGNSSGTIECSNGDSTSWTDEGDGTKTLTFTKYLDYNTTYYVWVNATVVEDTGTIYKNETFNFKTEKCTISGTITEEFWGAVPDVKIVADGPEQFITYTDNNGFYEIDVGTNYGSGVKYNVTASKFAYIFSPEYQLEDLERKVTNANFTGIHFFFKGTGTPDDPFTIRNCTHLNNVRLFYNYSFVLHGDLDMAECNITNWNGGKGFEPICNDTTPFNGTFDGGAYVISNLYSNYSDMDYMGLFGYVKNSDIQNLGLEQVNITGGNYTGSLAGYIDNTSILMCFAYSNNSIVGNNYAGGLVGVFENSSIQNSYARVNTTGITIGGMFGRTINSTVNLTYATGDVTGGGGLIGSQSGSTITNSYFDNQTSGTTTSEGGIGKNTTDMTSIDFWDTTEFIFPGIWFLDENQNDKYPILSIFTEITPPLLREINRAGSLAQQIYRYLNSSYNPEDYCFFNITAYVPVERYTGRWNKNVSDRYFIATGVEEEDWSDTKDNYVLASRVIATYTGYYDQMRVFTIWHGHYPSTLGCAIYSDKNGEPGDILGYTDAWNFPADRDSIWFPDYSHVWLTLDLDTPVLMAKDTAYWLVVTTNDTSMWRESYAMGGMNLSGMSDFIWTLGTTVGDEANVKMLPYNVTVNIPNKEYVDPYEGTEWEGMYGYWRGDVWNSTFSWPASFESAGWEQGKDSITSTNLSQLLIYALCTVDVSHVEIMDVTMTWGTGYEENIVWDQPVNLSRVSPNMNYWEYNKTDIAGGDWSTWKATLYDEFGNAESYDYYRWMNHGVTERIYFQCNVTTPPEGVKILNSTTDLYSNDWVFYLYEAYYDNTPDVYGDNEGRKQALRHEQGVDGSAYDTGYWTTEVPTDLYQERTCAFFVGGLWDQDVVIPDNITIENAFVSWWMGSGRQLVVNSTGAAQNIHWGRADIEASFDEFYIKDYGYGEWRAVTYDGLEDTIAWQDMPLTRRPSNDWINFNESTWYEPPFFDNSTGRITDKVVRQVVQKLDFSSLAGTDYPNTFDSNSIYQLFIGMDYDAMWSSGANAILANNRSHPSFVIFNIPDDDELMYTDSNNDGITDYEALYLYGLHPFWNDTDNDSFTDIQELSRDTGANLYRDYPGDSNIILIKDMKPFKGNSTDEWSITLSVTIENPNEQDMDVKWYILKNFTFNSSYINQNQLLEGEWELVQTNTSVSDGTYTMTYVPASGDNHWAVYASDGAWWGNRSSVFSGPNRQIDGTILRYGSGLEDVEVTAVYKNNGETYYNYTDENGYYKIDNMTGGEYIVTPSLYGYLFIPKNKSITISTENLTVNFEAVDPPQYSQENPYNASWDVNNTIIWSIFIDANYEFNWSIVCSDRNSSSDTNDTSGKKNLSLSDLEYDTWYTIWVNSSHSEYSYIKTNETYTFKVKEDKGFYPGWPVNFTATTYGQNQINLSWIKGMNATTTYIRYAEGSIPPSNRSSGNFLYNDTETSTNVTDLTEGTEYSFSAWSWNETYNSWSYMVIDNATTETYEPDYLNVSVSPGTIDFGLVNIGEYINTDDYYFNLTNEGMGCSIEISISNSQNWTFVNYSERGHNMFCMNLSKDKWASEESIKTDGITLVENLIWQDSVLFDIKLLMPTSLSHLSSGESFNITFTATPI